MPPAPKSVFSSDVVSEIASKIPRPFHIINLQELYAAEKNEPSKFRIMVKIDRSSPEEISVKRSGNTLTVETKREANQLDGGGVEHVTRSYQIPNEGYNEEFGQQIATDGIITLRGPDSPDLCQNVIPIHLDRLPHVKPGTIIRLNPPANWRANVPINFSPMTGNMVDVQRPNDNSVKQEDNGIERKEEEKTNGIPEENAEKADSDIPGGENGVPSDESA